MVNVHRGSVNVRLEGRIIKGQIWQGKLLRHPESLPAHARILRIQLMEPKTCSQKMHHVVPQNISFCIPLMPNACLHADCYSKQTQIATGQPTMISCTHRLTALPRASD